MMKDFSSLKPRKTAFDFFFGSDFFHQPEKSLPLEAGRICKIEQDQTEYLFSFHIPGIDPRDLSIDVTASAMIIRGQRYVSAVTRTSFERFFLVPEDADIERVEARLNGPDLTLKMPKCAEVS